MVSRTGAGSARRPADGRARPTPSQDRKGRNGKGPQQRAKYGQRRRRRRIWLRIGLGGGVAGVVLLLVFLMGGHRGSAGSYTYQVGQPGPGTIAPTFTLPSNMGGGFDLATQRGKTVLLYFQEGTDCEPCWTQLQAIQRDMTRFHEAGIDEVVSVTTDPIGSLRQAARTYGTAIPVLSDPNLAVSRRYDANSYGMMGTSMDGHSMIVVGPDGVIRWRADYGGAPNYTMYVPVPTMLAQMRAGMVPHGGS